jgi:methylated-DNA-[protein]-cysteine S-methyltransferase
MPFVRQLEKTDQEPLNFRPHQRDTCNAERMPRLRRGITMPLRRERRMRTLRIMKTVSSIRKEVQRATNISDFRRTVFDALLDVPKGYVTTYGALAKRIGCASAQAVGGALRRNPFAPRVPCHRVLAFDGSIGGFSGHRTGPNIARKIALLRSEGIALDDDGNLLDDSQLIPN